jgi:hypothetical protein
MRNYTVNRLPDTKELSTNNLLNYTSSLQYGLYRFRILNEQVIHGRPLSTQRVKYAASYYPPRRKPLWSAAARRRFSYWNTAA